MSTSAIETQTLQQYLAAKFGDALEVEGAVIDGYKSNVLMPGEEQFGFEIIDRSVTGRLQIAIGEYYTVRGYEVKNNEGGCLLKSGGLITWTVGVTIGNYFQVTVQNLE